MRLVWVRGVNLLFRFVFLSQLFCFLRFIVKVGLSRFDFFMFIIVVMFFCCVVGFRIQVLEVQIFIFFVVVGWGIKEYFFGGMGIVLKGNKQLKLFYVYYSLKFDDTRLIFLQRGFWKSQCFREEFQIFVVLFLRSFFLGK